MESKPDPGSEEAIKAGCTCPVIDNSYGNGYMSSDNFVVNTECPIHSEPVENSIDHTD